MKFLKKHFFNGLLPEFRWTNHVVKDKNILTFLLIFSSGIENRVKNYYFRQKNIAYYLFFIETA